MATPGITSAVRRLTDRVDRRLAPVGLMLERPAIVSLLFHSVFESREEIARDFVHPQEEATLETLRAVIEHLLSANYRFVSVSDIDLGLTKGHHYACVTFDDGYANNLRCLALLREYGVPAAIFVSTNHVAEARRYWWDALYSERRRRGVARSAIDAEIEHLKALPVSSIEAYLDREFSPGWRQPRSDVDRPLTPAELGDVAAEPLITIGNHTMAHEILTSLDPPMIEAQLGLAQQYVEGITGIQPSAVAYPNGAFDEIVLRIAAELRFTCGFTTMRRKETAPVTGARRLQLGRFQLAAAEDVDTQLRVVRSGIQLGNALRRARSRSLVR